MKKSTKRTKEKQQVGRAPGQPKGVTELTEQALEQVQGGFGASYPSWTDKHLPSEEATKG